MSEIYSGPRFADAALVTLDELQSGKLQAPEGTVAYEVQPGDNLTRIAQQSGYGSVEQLLANNPQYAERNPDLIYPGEVVFVPVQGATGESQATDAAAADLHEAQQASTQHQQDVAAGRPGVDGSDQKHYNQAVTQAGEEFDQTVLAEINAGIDYANGNSRGDYANSAIAAGERIAQRLEAQGYPEAAARTREVAQERADAINNEH